jgi:hypothetical protein
VQTSPNVLLNFNSDPISFLFDSPVDGVGFFNTSLADREQVTLFDGLGGILFQGDLLEGSVNFLGFVSDTPIARGEVVGISPTNGTIFIDNFSFGSVGDTPVPEPSTILLLGTGLLGLIGYRRRRRAA